MAWKVCSHYKKCDKYVYVKTLNQEYVILCLYEDDMLIMSTNRSVIDSTKRMLKPNFDMKDLCLVDVIIEIQITRNPIGCILSQSHYIEKVFKFFD